MSSRILLSLLPFLFVGLTATSQASSVAPSQRASIDPPTLAHDPEDRLAPSASERLAGRGGNIIRVGSDATSCDFDSLSSALAAANSGDTILLERNVDLYLGHTYQLFNRGMTIRGGYDDCLDDSPSGRTVLDADGQGRVFDIWLPGDSTSEMNVVLENLSIRGGLTGANAGGAGILIEGRQGLLSVDLNNVEVANNQLTSSVNGGGIRVLVNGAAEGGWPLLNVDNASIIQGNSTLGNGGGLACDNPLSHAHESTVVRIGSADILDNSATNGGGLSLNNCRNMFIYNGGPIFLIIPTGVIFANTASERGGGIYVTGSSVLSMRGSAGGGYGDSAHAAGVVFNTAQFGGGIYNEGLAVNLDDVVINGNEASEDGGGIYTDGAITRHRRQQDTACEPPETSGGLTSVPRCSRMNANTAINGSGGGYYATNGASLDVNRTIITGNESNLAGSVVRSTADNGSDPGVANFRSALVYGNSGATLFYAWQTSEINVAWSTITDNQVSGHVLRAFASGDDSAEVSLISSIVWEDSGTVVSIGGTGSQTAIGDCVIGHQISASVGFTQSFAYSNINPMLSTVDDKPYFPSNTSPAIDYCDGLNAEDGEIDLVGVERGSEHQGPEPVTPPSSVPTGTFDLGAYETEWGPLTDELFQDRFETE